MAIRETTAETASKKRKIFNGVCGSRHDLSSGFVYDDENDVRTRHWVGLDAFDQATMWDGDYVRDNAGSHKTRVIVKKRELEPTSSGGWTWGTQQEEVHNMVLVGNPDGRSKVYFDLTEPAHYTVIVKNEASGNCSGGQCKSGSTTVERLGMSDVEVSNCWYQFVFHEFYITEDEIARGNQADQFTNSGSGIPPQPPTDSGGGANPDDNRNAILGLSIGAGFLILLISKLK